MDTSKVYRDSQGNDCTIWQMIQREPEWAANRIQQGDAYFQAVEAALICWGMTTTGNAKVDLNNLICMEQQVCLDPAVSLDARTLIRSGRIEAARDCIEIIKTAHLSCDREVLIGAITSALGLEI